MGRGGRLREGNCKICLMSGGGFVLPGQVMLVSASLCPEHHLFLQNKYDVVCTRSHPTNACCFQCLKRIINFIQQHEKF